MMDIEFSQYVIDTIGIIGGISMALFFLTGSVWFLIKIVNWFKNR